MCGKKRYQYLNFERHMSSKMEKSRRHKRKEMITLFEQEPLLKEICENRDGIYWCWLAPSSACNFLFSSKERALRKAVLKMF